MTINNIESRDVRAVFADFSAAHQSQLLGLRELILDTAATLGQIGELEETLKWGQPSYLPVKPRVGTTVRLGVFNDNHTAMYFHCQSMLVERFRSTFGNELKYEKNRAILLDVAKPLPENQLKQCVRHALCYHLDKKR